MKKTLILSTFMVIGLTVNAQNKDAVALEVVKKIHVNDVEGKIRIRAAKAADSIKIKNSENDVYSKIAEDYRTQFNKEELKDLLTFYNSDLGKKFLNNKDENSKNASKYLFAIKRKQREEEFKNRPSREERKELLDKSDAEKSNKRIQKSKKEDYPEIETLEDLRKILLKNPRLIRDPQLSKKILREDISK